jgi:hypothetical protein
MLYYGQSAWCRGTEATFPKCDAWVNYHLIILSSLLWECPQLGAFQIWRCMQGQVFSEVENLTNISSASDQTKFQGRRKKPFLRQHCLQHVKDWYSIDLSSSKINSLNYNYDFFPPTNIILQGFSFLNFVRWVVAWSSTRGLAKFYFSTTCDLGSYVIIHMRWINHECKHMYRSQVIDTQLLRCPRPLILGLS